MGPLSWGRAKLNILGLPGSPHLAYGDYCLAPETELDQEEITKGLNKQNRHKFCVLYLQIFCCAALKHLHWMSHVFVYFS